jgi:hypothetical protein
MSSINSNVDIENLKDMESTETLTGMLVISERKLPQTLYLSKVHHFVNT